MNFEDEISLSPFLKLWDRGDGIGEISCFNHIIGYIHGQQPIYPEDYFHYDETTDSYVEDDVDFSPVSCFPGQLTSHHKMLISLNNIEIDCIDHLSSLIQSISTEFLPAKPKGSVLDVFSNQEKFLISRNFDFDIIKNGVDLPPSILDNFNHFSYYLKNYFVNYPDVSIVFGQHCYLNGNVYFLYHINEKYCLHLVFNQDNQVILGIINKSHKMNIHSILDCSDNTYLSICEYIINKLKISSEKAIIHISLSKESVNNLPLRKNHFIQTLIDQQIEEFIFKLTNSSIFIIQRNITSISYEKHLITIDRATLITIQDQIRIFDIDISTFFSLFINAYYNKLL